MKNLLDLPQSLQRLGQQMAPNLYNYHGGQSGLGGAQHAPTLFGGGGGKAMAPTLAEASDRHPVGRDKAGNAIIAQQAAPSSLTDILLPPTQQQLVTRTGDGGTLINQDTNIYKLSLI